MRKMTKAIGRLTLISVVMAAPLPALALSCMRPDPVQTVEWLNEAGTEHTVIYGTLQFSGDFSSFTQETPHDPFPEDQIKPAVLMGENLLTGQPYDEIIMIERQCSGIWCGGVSAGEDLLVIVEDPEDSPTLRPGACGGQVFRDFDKEMLQDVKDALLTPSTR
jgi:hypothetical protein